MLLVPFIPWLPVALQWAVSSLKFFAELQGAAASLLPAQLAPTCVPHFAAPTAVNPRQPQPISPISSLSHCCTLPTAVLALSEPSF